MPEQDEPLEVLLEAMALLLVRWPALDERARDVVVACVTRAHDAAWGDGADNDPSVAKLDEHRNRRNQKP